MLWQIDANGRPPSRYQGLEKNQAVVLPLRDVLPHAVLLVPLRTTG